MLVETDDLVRAGIPPSTILYWTRTGRLALKDGFDAANVAEVLAGYHRRKAELEAQRPDDEERE